MLAVENLVKTKRVAHSWLKTISVHFAPNISTPLLEVAQNNLRVHFAAQGHTVQPAPTDETDVIITTARFGQPVPWREALMMTGRKRFSLKRTPTVFTLVHITPDEFYEALDQLSVALLKEPLDPADFAYAGMAPQAHRTLIEQGKRGGPMMALIRRVQAQAMSIRNVLLVGESAPETAFHFDLVGMHPRTEAADESDFYADMVRRVVTAVSTREVTQHLVSERGITEGEWAALSTPAAMRHAGRQLGQRGFFTEMVRVSDLVTVPALSDAISSQYSEGCFATWDADIDALLATITGSARPVAKDNLTDDELAVITGVRADGVGGAVVRHVAGKRNDSPSSESVEMMDMDYALPKLTLGAEWGGWAGRDVPVVRSKLHGHRGIAAYNPALVEWVRLDEAYYHYPVSCSTEAQAWAIKAAFARAECLRHPADPRQIAFTVLPGHGIVVAEKWVAGREPLQQIWEAMDSGDLQVDNLIPQGLHTFTLGADGRRWVKEG
jgi:hypothetical protein